MAPPHTPLLPGGVFTLNTPLPSDTSSGFKMYPCFKGRSRNARLLSCHASSLEPRHRPHPPHQHGEEEFLLVLAGEVDIILPDIPSGSRHLKTGEFAYYPANFRHTLEATGAAPANYLMLKWAGQANSAPDLLPFRTGSLPPSCPAAQPASLFRSTLLFEGRTLYQAKFHAHLSEVEPGGGYGAHSDGHDVVIIVLNGEIETGGHRIHPHGVAYHAAGELHGMANPGPVPARYLVLEFHGHKAERRLLSKAATFITAHARNEYRLWSARVRRLAGMP